jgi:hypothetical protein
MESLSTLSFTRISAGTQIGYKTLPTIYCELTSDAFPGQTDEDWSAIYA